MDIVEELQTLTLKHYENPEDPWYSCPMSGDWADDRLDKDTCTCGAQVHNAKLSRIIRHCIQMGY